MMSKNEGIMRFAISSKFTEWVFCPANAIERGFYNRDASAVYGFRTIDGANALPQFVGTWNNTGGEFDEEFERICQDRYGLPFVNIRSIWISRLGYVENFWHLIKLERG